MGELQRERRSRRPQRAHVLGPARTRTRQSRLPYQSGCSTCAQQQGWGAWKRALGAGTRHAPSPLKGHGRCSAPRRLGGCLIARRWCSCKPTRRVLAFRECGLECMLAPPNCRALRRSHALVHCSICGGAGSEHVLGCRAGADQSAAAMADADGTVSLATRVAIALGVVSIAYVLLSTARSVVSSVVGAVRALLPQPPPKKKARRAADDVFRWAGRQQGTSASGGRAGETHCRAAHPPARPPAALARLRSWRAGRPRRRRRRAPHSRRCSRRLASTARGEEGVVGRRGAHGAPAPANLPATDTPPARSRSATAPTAIPRVSSSWPRSRATRMQ